MARYISDRELAALARYDELTSEPDSDELFPASIRPVWLLALAGGLLLASGLIWYLYDGVGPAGEAPLVLADSTPYKVRPDQPGGIEIPFQDMVLYDRLRDQPEDATPMLASPPETPDLSVLDHGPVAAGMTEIDPATPDADTSGSGPRPAGGLPAHLPQTLANGEGESLFADPASGGAVPSAVLPPLPPLPAPAGQQAASSAPTGASQSESTPESQPEDMSQSASEAAPGHDAPPVPVHHPLRTRGVATANESGQAAGSQYFGAPGTQVGPDQAAQIEAKTRLIHRGTIVSSEIPLAAAQAGLQPGGALGQTDHSGNLIYRNSIDQDAAQPVPDQPVEGEIQIRMQPEGSQDSGITVKPAVPERRPDGVIEIRSPDRTPPIEITSAPASAAKAQGSSASARPQSARAEPTPRLIPVPPSAPAGAVSGPSAKPAASPAPKPIAEANNLPESARAPTASATAITRGTVINQRAPIPPGMVATSVNSRPSGAVPASAPATPAAATAPPEPAPAPAAADGWRIQLAAVRSQDAAASEWRRYKRLYNDLLGNLDVRIQKADLGDRGIYYRIQAGLLSRDDADQLCRTLKSRGGSCLLVRN